jgi:hypothetical protein
MEEHQSCSFDLKESDHTVIASLNVTDIIAKDGKYIINVPNPKVGKRYTLEFTTCTGVKTNLFWVIDMRVEIVVHGRKLAFIYNTLASISIDEDDTNWGNILKHVENIDLPLHIIEPASQYRYQAHDSSEYETILHAACIFCT